MKIRNVWRTAGAAAVLALAVAAGGCLGPRGKVAEELRVGCVADYPPMIFRQGGTFQGAEADLARALGARFGRDVKFVAMPFDRLGDALLNGQVDILMAAMTVTDQRRVRMSFCTPYLVVGQMALVRLPEARKYRTAVQIMTMNGRVGVVGGTTGAQLVERNFMNAAKTSFLTAADAIGALRNNQVDVVIHDAPAVWYAAAEHEAELTTAGGLLTMEEIAWAVRPGDMALLEAVNAALADWKEDGTLDRILGAHFPFSK
jgi:polar amino acid transport system substrate-binding protein